MNAATSYSPGPAFGTEIRKEGEKWTLVVVRELRHPPEKVWLALTDPEHLRAWAPFEPDRNLASVGAARLATVGMPASQAAESRVTRADAPELLEFDWGGQSLRWQLERQAAGGTRLTLWHAIDRNFIAMGAAGWHICLDVLEHALAGTPVGRIVGPDAMKFEGWQRLHAEYASRFGLPMPSWGNESPKA